MSKDALGRAAAGPRDPSQDRRGKAISAFMEVMQYRRDLRDAREIVATIYGAPAAARLDPDITQANVALRDAVLELEASRGG